jgi:hypothetical protein
MSIGGPQSSWSVRAARPADEAAKRHPCLTLVILLLLLVNQAAGQSAAFATIAGRVQDLNGESVARATIADQDGEGHGSEEPTPQKVVSINLIT